MSWQPEVEELQRRCERARELGGAERVQRQHDDGKLTIRERIACLVDPGSFHEVGQLAGSATYENGELRRFVPAPYVMGLRKSIDFRVRPPVKSFLRLSTYSVQKFPQQTKVRRTDDAFHVVYRTRLSLRSGRRAGQIP